MLSLLAEASVEILILRPSCRTVVKAIGWRRVGDFELS